MNNTELTGRVFSAGRDAWGVATEAGEMQARISGALRHRAASPADLPAVGDYVVVADGLIRRVLRRRTTFSRRAAGRRTEEQVLAANVDTAFLVCGLDGDYNPRRLERYLVLVRESGVAPVVVLNKADLRPETIDDAIADCRAVTRAVPVVTASTRTPDGLAGLAPYLAAGRTIVLLGSSGAGKSSIANQLAGRDLLRTQPVRAHDSRGRHTTTHRELIALPGGAFLIDTPGLRELQLWADGDSVAAAFDDIEALAESCRFSDCSHEGEPGCAVGAAVEAGNLSESRWRSYIKLTSEVLRLDPKSIRKLSRQMRHYKQRWD